ncbi:MAG: hypothetical protein JNM68_14070 [Dinghuibacter sp.]|nr:hypothetical protein [Dinghuibacter sp.]
MQKFRVSFFMLPLFAGMMLVSCKKDAEFVEEEAQIEQKPGIFEGDHTTLTPEREREIAEFENYRRTGLVLDEVYRGFTINWGANVPADIVTLIKADVDRVFTSGVTSTTITRMQGAPINVFDGGTSGNLYYTGGQVYITSYSQYRSVQSQTPAGPVIFHELIHYYHDRHITGGFNNTTVNNLYNNAKRKKAYPRTAYVLTNNREYLATSSEGYFPTTFRIPYTPAYVTQQDPDCATYLAANF